MIFTDAKKKAPSWVLFCYCSLDFSSSSLLIDFMNKKVRTEQIINTLELLHKYNIKYHANILLGFENETYNDIQREVSLIPPKYNLIPAIVQPYIGTKNGRTRLISKHEEAYLSHLFKEYAENKNLVYMETI